MRKLRMILVAAGLVFLANPRAVWATTFSDDVLISGNDLFFGGGGKVSIDFQEGGSRIYDDTHLRIVTNDDMYLNVPGAIYVQNKINFGTGTETLSFDKGNTQIYDNGNLTLWTNDYLDIWAPHGVVFEGGNSLDFAGQGRVEIDFNEGGSKIYDDANLHLATNDYMYLDAPNTLYVQNALNVGGSLSVSGGLSFPSGGINSAMIGDGTIATADLADNSVTSNKILDGTVGAADLADGSVANADLADNSVTSGKIIDGAIATADLANSVVTSEKVLDGTITGSDLATGIAITGSTLSTTGLATLDNLTTDAVTAATMSTTGLATLDNVTTDAVTSATLSATGLATLDNLTTDAITATTLSTTGLATLDNLTTDSITTAGNITVADNSWIGLGSGIGRIEFDDQSTDEINVLSANLGVGTSTPWGDLTISNGVSSNAELYIGETLSSTGHIYWDGTGNQLIMRTYGASPHDYPIHIGPTSVGGLYIDTDINSGRVGVGTTMPGANMEVIGMLQSTEVVGASFTLRDNLVTNGSMEIDSNWNDYLTPTGNQRSSSLPHSGTYSRLVMTDAAQEGIQSDTFSTTTGRRYQVSLWVRMGNGTVDITVQRGDASGGYSIGSVSSTGWTNLSAVYTEDAGGSLARVIIMSSGGTASWNVDDVVVTELGTNNAPTNAPLFVDVDGRVSVGSSSPQSSLYVSDGNYAQFGDNNAGAPPSVDCDADTERGRLSIDTTNNRLYICNGATRGWDWVTLTD